MEGFHVGRFYACNEKDPKTFVKVTDKTRMELVLEIEGEERKLPRFI